MPNKVSPIFDPQAFLTTINRGRTVTIHRKNSVIFRQTAAADAVFYVMRGRVKIAVTSKQGKEAVVGIMGQLLQVEIRLGRYIRRSIHEGGQAGGGVAG